MPIFKKTTTDQEFLSQDLTPPIMAAPYKVIAADLGHSLTLKKNKDYWGLSTPQGKARFHFDTVKFEFFQSDMAAFENMRAGQSDFFYENNLKRLHTSYHFPAIENGTYKINKIKTGRPAGFYSFTLNTRRAHLQDKALRKALFLAFDFAAVNHDYLFGAFDQARSLFEGSPLAYKHYYEIETHPKDMRERLKLAHKILKDQGYYFKKGKLYAPKGQEITLRLLLNNPSDEKFAGALKQDLEKIGVRLDIQVADDSMYQHLLNQFNYDMIIYSWYNSLSPGIEQKNYWHCESKNRLGSRNYAGICKPEIDALVDKLVAAKTRKELVKHTAKLDYMLLKDYYFIPLYARQYYHIIAKDNITPSKGGATYFTTSPR